MAETRKPWNITKREERKTRLNFVLGIPWLWDRDYELEIKECKRTYKWGKNKKSLIYKEVERWLNKQSLLLLLSSSQLIITKYCVLLSVADTHVKLVTLFKNLCTNHCHMSTMQIILAICLTWKWVAFGVFIIIGVVLPLSWHFR